MMMTTKRTIPMLVLFLYLLLSLLYLLGSQPISAYTVSIDTSVHMGTYASGYQVSTMDQASGVEAIYENSNVNNLEVNSPEYLIHRE